MTVIFRLALLLTFSIMMVGCATTPVVLNHDVLLSNKIGNIHFQSLEQPLEIEGSSAGASSGAMVGGLLGVMVGSAMDAGVNANRRSRFKPIADALTDFDTNSVLLEELSRVQGIVFADNLNVTVEGKLPKQQPSEILITPTVTMNPNFATVTTLLYASMDQVSPDDKRYGNVYRGQALAESQGLEAGEDEYSLYWQANPDKLKEAIIKSVKIAVDALEADFNTPPVVDPNT